MPQDEDFALAIGQASKGRPDPSPRLFADRRFLGRGLLARERDVFDAVASPLKPPPPAGSMAVPARVDGHARQPRPPVAHRLGVATRLVKSHKHFLHDLPALLAIAEQQST